MVQYFELIALNLAPIEDLDGNILTLCSHINAATYELLVLIREFDERAGWLKWGLKNCAEWLAWRCDFSMTTALEKVRVAHALKTLPGIAVPKFGYSSRDMIDEELYPKGTWSDVVEIPPAGGLLSGPENKVFEPPPPAYLH